MISHKSPLLSKSFFKACPMVKKNSLEILELTRLCICNYLFYFLGRKNEKRKGTNFGKSYLNLKFPALTTSQNQTKIYQYQKSDMKLCIYNWLPLSVRSCEDPRSTKLTVICALQIFKYRIFINEYIYCHNQVELTETVRLSFLRTCGRVQLLFLTMCFKPICLLLTGRLALFYFT